MKKKLPFLFLFLGILILRAQDKDWSIELSYPISVGDEFGSYNQGIVGLGVKYRVVTAGKLQFGPSINATWFATTTTNDSDPIQQLEFRDFFFQPRFFAELPISPNKRLYLRGGLGWTWFRSAGESFIDQVGEVQGVEWNNGLNLNLGMSYNLSVSWYAHVQYNLIFSSENSPNSRIGLIQVGGGFRF